MANNLSFYVRLELLADKFRQEAESAKSAIRGIQFQALAMAGALGAGVTSLWGLISTLVQSAREAGRARTILRNVSRDSREYGQSLRFVSELAEKYGTDLIGTTDAFAKFKAAAGSMGVVAQEQEHIFANISKAMASFGISGGEASLTMTAITQMMSKGKISSEELRSQLGERMPIAMQAMANAAGVSLAQLDKLLKEGKLRSADIMGKFSDELAKLSGDISTDNLESSLGRLKNAFTSIADDLHIYDHFKTAVDKVKELLDYLKGHLSNLYIWAGGVLSLRLWGKFSNAWNDASSLLRTEQAKSIASDAEAKRKAQHAAQEAQRALAEADAKIARAEAALTAGSASTSNEAKRIATATKKGDAKFASAVNNLSKAQADYRQLTSLHETYLRGLEAKEIEVAQRVASAKATLSTATASGDSLAIREAQRSYDKVLAEASRLTTANAYKREEAEVRYAFRADELQKKIAASGQALNQAQHERKELLAKAHAQNEETRIKRLASLQASLSRANADRVAIGARTTNLPVSSASVGGALNTQRAIANAGRLTFQPTEITAASERAASATVGIWTRTTATFRVLWTSAVATVRSVMSTLVPLAIIGAITAIITKMVDWYNKQKEINGLQAKYRSDLNSISSSHSEESQKLLHLFDTYKGLHGQVEEQKIVQHQIERSLGLQEGALDRLRGKYEDIRSIISSTIKVKDLERQSDFLAQTENEAKGHLNKRRTAYLIKHPEAELPQSSMDAIGKAMAAYSGAGMLRAAKEMKDAGGGINGIQYRTLINSFWQENRRLPSKDERAFLWSEVKSGWTSQDLRESIGYAKVAIQASKDRAQTDEAVAKANVEYEQKLKEYSLSTLSGTTGGEEHGNEKRGKKSDLQRAREAAERDQLAVENRHAAGLYESTDAYRLALNKVAQTHIEHLGSLLGVQSKEDEQVKSLQALLLTDRELIEEKEKSRRELATLAIKYQVGIATQDDLIEATAERARAELSAAISSGRHIDLSDEWVQAKLAEIAETSAISSLQREYNQSTDRLMQERVAGILSEREYHEALAELISTTRKKAITTATYTPTEEARKKDLSDSLTGALKSLAPALLPQREKRDTTTDYKKDDETKQKEEQKLLEDYINELKKAERAGLDVGDALREAQAEAKTLDKALRLAELEGDLKKYQQAVENKTLSGIKTVAQSARNLKSAFDSLQKAFDPEENASAWERFFAVFDSASQGIDTILSLVSMVKELQQAKELAHAVDKVITSEKIAQNATVLASEATATSTEVGLSATRTAAASVEAKADTVGAAAKVAKAHAALPFVGVAIAGAMIGALIATIASSASKVPKFANGGIVPGGDGSGDHVLARVNPGELILNKAQQGRLANHLTQSSALHIEVEGRIRARDILQLSTVATRHKSR